MSQARALWPPSYGFGFQKGSAENFEIACYNALIAAAQELGDQETIRMCEEIRDEELEMADWLDEHLPVAVHEAILQRERQHK